MLSPRALVRGNPARAKFAAENIDIQIWQPEKYVKQSHKAPIVLYFTALTRKLTSGMHKILQGLK